MRTTLLKKLSTMKPNSNPKETWGNPRTKMMWGEYIDYVESQIESGMMPSKYQTWLSRELEMLTEEGEGQC